MLVIIASVVSMSAGDRGGVLQGRPRHLGRIDDAGLEHVDELAGVGVEADRAVSRLDLFGDHAAVMARVGRDVADRLLERPQDDRRADLLVARQASRGASGRPE